VTRLGYRAWVTTALVAAFLTAVSAALPTGFALAATVPRPDSTARKPAARQAPGTARPGGTGSGVLGAKPRARPATATPSTARPAAKQPAAPTASAYEQALEARNLEDLGAYTRAVESIRAIRGRVRPDGDLELALALNEARAGRLDSAAVRLQGPMLSAAALDTMPSSRWHEYPVDRERQWFNGHFDGWHWYVWRARAEVAASQGRWADALEAARWCTRWRANSGKEWLLAAICAAHVGEDEASRQAVTLALRLDPTLPEAYYLAGLWSWKAGRRSEAQASFREAVFRDSTYQAAALALVRSRLPGAPPDSFPGELLSGPRIAALLTSPAGPKLEDEAHLDTPPAVVKSFDPLKDDTLRAGTKPFYMTVSLLVDERGRVLVNDLPWFSQDEIPSWKVSRLLASLPAWEFSPGIRHGERRRSWTALDLKVYP
jgi:hypothetical protein